MSNGQPVKIKIIRKEQPTEPAEKEERTEKRQTGPWLKIAEVCLYLLIFLAPLFFLPWTIAPVEINKQFLAAVLLFAAFACYLIDSLENKRVIYPKSLLALAIAILLAVAGLSAIFSKSPQLSLWGNFVQPDSLINFALYGLAFYLGAVLFGQQMKTAGLIFSAGLALSVVFGLLQMFGVFILPWDFSRQPDFNAVGNLSDWGIFISFGLAMITSVLSDRADKPYRIYLLGLLGLLIAAGLVILNNQFLWLSLALAMAALAAYKFTIKSKPGLSLIILMVALFFFLTGASLPALLKNLPTEVKPTFSSTFQVAKEAVFGKMTKMTLLGSGPATFGYEWNLFRPVEINQTSFWQVRFNQGFSFAATALTTTGAVGILTILFLIFSFAKTAVSFFAEQEDWRGQNLATAIFGGTTFLLISWFFQPAFFAQMIFVFLSLGFVVSLSSSQKEISLAGLSQRKPFIPFVAFVVLLIASLASFSLITRKYIAAVYYGEGIRVSQKGNLTETLLNLEKAAELDQRNDQYQRGLSQVQLSQARELIRQNPTANLQDEGGLRIINILSAALQSGRSAAESNPADSFNWNNLGNIYENLIPLTGEADKFAIESYRKAAELDPKNPQEMVNLARAFLASAQKANSLQSGSSGDKIKEARQILEKSLGLMPNYRPAVDLLNQIKQMGY